MARLLPFLNNWCRYRMLGLAHLWHCRILRSCRQCARMQEGAKFESTQRVAKKLGCRLFKKGISEARRESSLRAKGMAQSVLLYSLLFAPCALQAGTME